MKFVTTLLHLEKAKGDNTNIADAKLQIANQLADDCAAGGITNPDRIHVVIISEDDSPGTGTGTTA